MARNCIEEILYIDSNNKIAIKMAEEVKIIELKEKLQRLISNDEELLYDENGFKLLGKEYYVFFVQAKGGGYMNENRFCVEKETEEIFINNSIGELLTVDEFYEKYIIGR